MAKRQPKYQNQAAAFEKRRTLFLKIVWGVYGNSDLFLSESKT